MSTRPARLAGPSWRATAKERSLDERFAVYVQSLYSWLSSFEHDDEEAIKGCVMTGAEANVALTSAGGVLYRLARDRASIGSALWCPGPFGRGTVVSGFVTAAAAAGAGRIRRAVSGPDGLRQRR